MRSKFIYLFLLIGLVSFTLSARAQNATGGKADLVSGEAVAVESGKISLRTKDGTIDVTVSGATVFKRISPENPNPAAAAAAAFTDIGAGDKLLVSGFFSADKKTLPARTVYLISKSDLAQKLNKDSEEWKTRGITGRVTSVDAATGAITASVNSGFAGNKTVIITPKANAEFMRYAPDSVNYSDAKSSSVKEVVAGDIIRALGDKSADGATFAAERVITGAFQTIGGTVKSIDAAKNEIVIENIQTKKEMTIKVNDNSTLKKFPEELAQRLARFQAMRASGMQPPAGNGGGETANRSGGQGGAGRGDINEMFERLPPITVADLKPGDMIAISSQRGDDPTRATAIRLLAGVEPFLKSAQGNSGGGRRGGQSGQDSGFTIPGLDGISGF